MFLLALQHYIVMLGNTVLLSSLLVTGAGGTNVDKATIIQSTLLISGVNTLLQTLIGTRLPTVMGPSTAYIVTTALIIKDFTTSDQQHQNFLYTMRAIEGAMIVSSFITILLGYCKIWAYITRYFSPLVIVSLVSHVGLGLVPKALPTLQRCVADFMPTLLVLVILQELKHIHRRTAVVFERFALLFSVGFTWSLFAILTIAGAYNSTEQSCQTNTSYLLPSAAWFKIPHPFEWGPPIIRGSHIVGMVAASLVSSAESTGAFYATSRLAGATSPPSYVISRSIGLQGVGQLIGGIFGAVLGTTASVENVGLLGLTQVGSRKVVQVSAGIMIFSDIFGKFGAIFASISLPIFVAVNCILHSIVAGTGVSFIQFTSNSSLRNIRILGISLFLGTIISSYFLQINHINTKAAWFNVILNTTFSSASVIVLIIGVLLDRTRDARSCDGRIIPWWIPFETRSRDTRNNLFYDYPAILNSLIPDSFR